MSTANKYEDMSALTALKYAAEGNLLLPDIQREYVWDTYEIEALFESIVDDYPIGACIFWKTNRATINRDKPNLYHFFNKFEILKKYFNCLLYICVFSFNKIHSTIN